MRKGRKYISTKHAHVLWYNIFIVGFSEHNHALKNVNHPPPFFFSFSTKQLGFLYIFYILYFVFYIIDFIFDFSWYSVKLYKRSTVSN